MSDENKESNVENNYQDIDYSIQTLGPHYIDKKYFKTGYVYKLVGNKPGQIEKFENLGHTIVKDEVKIGSEKPNQPHSLSSAVTVQSGCGQTMYRSEEHTSELQSHSDLVCRLLLEKKKYNEQNSKRT